MLFRSLQGAVHEPFRVSGFAGDIVDVADLKAAQMIECGLAEPAEGEQVETAESKEVKTAKKAVKKK